ncbi:non-ribosomal peptide synthetase [Kineosporia sp. NBRC 101731]|uniref:non-ribosomal peptide synthetase n=1 Tax=Kineosporia sp. NBRC 101731 TaxID=3032199 RepID=UPI0024A5F4E5|nr:non-ribosomal peptide synthetase [Kineosporia sp. NBRC 101731]GLY32372.1 non-ribosomal peptide synthetase [Kineosporia sp. NBRC 101731]
MTPLPDPLLDLARALGLGLAELAGLDEESDLFELGLDSLTVIRLTGQWRKAGLDVGFAELVEDPTPAGWRRALDAASTLTQALSAPAPSDETPVELATLQHAYWVGRQDGQPFGGVAAHFYVELDGHGVDPDRLRGALRRIVSRHAMLRLRITPEGRQWTAPDATADQADITVHDLRAQQPHQLRLTLEQAREHLTHRRMDVDSGQVLDLQLSLLPHGATRLHIDLDMIAADALSLRVLVADLARAYADPGWNEPEPESSYRSYLLAPEDERRGTDRLWWSERAADLPAAPQLPLLPDAGAPGKAARSARLHHWASPSTTAALGRAAAAHGVTVAATLATAFAESIGAWCEQPQFLLNLPLFNRRPIVPDVESLLGDFSSSVLLPVDVSGRVNFAERASRVRVDLHAAIAHGSYGGVEVLRDLARIRGGTVLAPVVYTSAVGMGEIYGPGVRECFGSPVWTVSQGPQVWLDAQVTEHEGGLLLNWDVRLDVLREPAARAAFDAYRNLVTALAEDPGAWQRPGRPALPQVQVQARRELDATDRRHPPRLLQAGFLEQVRRDPHWPAVVFGQQVLSYTGLFDLARNTAHVLLQAGAAPGDSVVITLPKGPEQVVAAIGVLLAGCTYVPVGIDQPAARRHRIHQASGAKLALTDLEHQAAVEGAGAQGLLVFAQAHAGQPVGLPDPRPEDIAYVLFTSGSTGEPKGVEISHAAAANTIDALNERFGIGPDDRVLTVSALEFDLSVYDVFGILSAGGTLVVVPQEHRADPLAWHAAVLRHGVTVWNTVPPIFDLLLRTAEATAKPGLPLRSVLLGGDRVSGDLPGRLHALAPQARFAALGGMTEAAIHSTVFEVRAGDAVDPADPSLPWGLPLDGMACRVVDGDGRDRPDDVVGELWMGGAGLARGYRGDLGRTAERFVQDGLRRWYRTGDLAVVRPGGGLEFAGRADHQVKISGHRIELGEIEAALTAHPRVQDACVQAVQTVGTGAGVQLAGLVVLREPDEHLPDLAAWLTDQLPAHMRCSWFVAAASIPLTGNGKIDRTAVRNRLLKAPPGNTSHASDGEPPRTAVEQAVAVTWQKLLGVAQVSREDDFFALGGDSLLATRLLVALNQAGVRGATLGAVFAHPTLAGLCAGLSLGSAATAQPPELLTSAPAQRHAPFPLTDVQRAYLIGRNPELPLGGVGTWQYNEFDGVDVDLERLQSAWDTVWARHDMLRAVIRGGHQVIPEYPAEVKIAVHDVPAGTDPTPALEHLRATMSHRVVDLAEGPLVEIGVVRYRQDGRVRTRMGIGYDYIVLDALSIMRVLTELDLLYTNPETELPPVGPSFRDYVLAHHGHDPNPEHVQHWENRLAHLPPAPALPLIATPAEISAPTFERRQHLLAPDTWQALQERARTIRVTVPSVLFAAYGEVLAHWSGSSGVTVTLTRFERRPVHPQIDLAVGDFTSLAPAGYERAAMTTFTEAVRAVHRRTGEDLDHSDVPASWLLRRLATASGEGQPVPVVFTSAVGVGEQVTMDRSPGFPQPVWGLSQSPQVCLDNQVLPARGGLQVTWDSAQGLLSQETLDDMFQAYLQLLTWLADNDWDAALPDLLPPRQRQVRKRVSATGDGGPPATLLTPILHQAAVRPNDPALVAADEPNAPTTSFSELQHGIERWAGLLDQAGVQPGDLVAVSLPKGRSQVIAALGVIAAGAAYVPVSRSAPAVRREQLLSRTPYVITDTEEGVPDRTIRLNPVHLSSALSRPAVQAAPDDLAYVIFTSGSTGEPKGVQITHDAAANTCRDIATRYQVTPEDRVLGLSALEFDLSVFDIFGVLGAGGTLVLPGEQERRDPAHWLQQVRTHRVTLWNTVPALLDLVLSEAGTEGLPSSLRLALVSGDWVGLDLSARLSQATGGKGHLVALGGATEAAIWSNAYDVAQVPQHWTSIPYGFALSGQRYRVVDPGGRDAPDGVAGELWIGGRGVARGYLGDPSRTAQRFVDVDGERWYRTGDLGRFWADGTLEFLGRTDHQVKINGHRLELGEVEAALENLPSVARAVVVAPGPRNRRTLHAVLESAEGDAQAVRRALQAVLPAHAVPSRISFVHQLPLTANGKVDRGALLAAAETTDNEQGTTGRALLETETALSPLWAEATGNLQVDPDLGFFAAGGDSLAALRLVAAVRDRFRVPISARDLFVTPTLAALAQHVDAARADMDEGAL